MIKLLIFESFVNKKNLLFTNRFKRLNFYFFDALPKLYAIITENIHICITKGITTKGTLMQTSVGFLFLLNIIVNYNETTLFH